MSLEESSGQVSTSIAHGKREINAPHNYHPVHSLASPCTVSTCPIGTRQVTWRNKGVCGNIEHVAQFSVFQLFQSS